MVGQQNKRGMNMDISESVALELPKVSPQQIRPGEIWEISRRVRSPLEFSREEQESLYPDAARRFLNGDSLPRYVMIVKEPEPAVELDEEWRIVSVMLLSVKTDRLSDADILIPSQVSGVGQDLLAETWHVLPVLTCNLSHPTGHRLSRHIYNVLLDVGDCYHGLIDQPPAVEEIESLGLRVGAVSAQQPEIQAFHRLEEDWAAVLQVPVAACRTYLKAMRVTDAILEMAIEQEREISENFGLVHLSQWFQGAVEAGWDTVAELLKAQGAQQAFSFRKGAGAGETPPGNSQEIAALIKQLSSSRNETQRRQAAKKLGETGTGNSDAINALIEVLSATEDEETLWTAAESLWRIDPDNPAAGIRRGKLIDLGQPAGEPVVLTVALIQKAVMVYILLRVYPTGDKVYLPAQLQLILLDESGKSVLEVTARRADACIQLILSGNPGERFAVRVALGDAGVTEYFLI
jgi:hypothetical protein